jgi:hypothetical protein
MALFTRPLSLVAWLLPLTFTLAAEARPFRVNDIPNGSKFGCLNCHGDTKASYNTDFGSDARFYLIPVGEVTKQHVDWTPLCKLDSDRDGWTNGVELGDPDCVWKLGDPDPKGFLFNPGVFESAPAPVCGSGVLEANEACDGDLFVETNCKFLGAGEGTLGCTADCKFDYSECSAPPGSMPIPNEQLNPVNDGGCSVARGGHEHDWGWLVCVGMGMVWGYRRRCRE